ncbi:MAG TPA: cob(I)yrinic acid a,c-diamide adenosyltransferase [Lentisphaeria bacterium]|nr:MAG: cob(I)yrinic acid a,c-diamide adenosyltransferase [Lentisphaerae bacterium GWF2_38_69]HBM17358.1 cob(I)yrinic acid a,c-diamide adenosyltransferase [Lentisphaeria bacterium]
MDNKGLIIILTGDGKGKSSSAFGMMNRALGWEKKVLLVQFLKGLWESGEGRFFESLKSDKLHIIRAECPFTWKSKDKDKDALICRNIWEQSLNMIRENNYDLVVFDELMITLQQNFLNLNDVIEFLKDRAFSLDVIMTGRNAPEELIDIADTVSEVRVIKHAFDKRVLAKKGIDF